MPAKRKTKTSATIIRFFAPVREQSIQKLLAAVDQKLREGEKRFHILISSPGGSVLHGLTAYNYLRGIPAEIITHNVGSVDSIGVVLYCGGSVRKSVPQARFLLHGVSARFERSALEDKKLDERIKSLRIDTDNIAKVIAANTGKSAGEVIEAMRERTALNPEQAREWGLVHDIESELFPPGAEVLAVE